VKEVYTFPPGSVPDLYFYHMVLRLESALGEDNEKNEESEK
jgi:hypothetical protein